MGEPLHDEVGEQLSAHIVAFAGQGHAGEVRGIAIDARGAEFFQGLYIGFKAMQPVLSVLAVLGGKQFVGDVVAFFVGEVAGGIGLIEERS